MQYQKFIYPKWCIFKPEKIEQCVICLPGRGQSGFELAGYYNTMELPNTIIVGVSPSDFEWYPPPQGATNQKAATEGQKTSLQTARQLIQDILTKFNVAETQTTLVGYSAGGVMALQLSTMFDFDKVVVHSGAVLEPHCLPICQNKTKFLIIHGLHDEAFEWLERYQPMKQALINQKYQAKFIERFGGHEILPSDLLTVRDFLEKNNAA